MPKTAVRTLFAALLLLALLLTAAQVILSIGLLPPRAINLKDIRHESGHAYMGVIGTSAYSSHQGPSAAVLYEDQVRLGPANCLHDDIRKRGLGAFSVWHDTVYFSTSDNTNPLKNKRIYSLRVPWVGSLGRKVIAITMWVSWLAVAIMGLLLARTRRTTETTEAESGEVDSRNSEGSAAKTSKGGFPNWLLIPISIILCLVVLEVIIRFVDKPQEGINLPSLPVVWDKEIGWHYKPGATCEYQVRHHDGTVETTRHKANQWGFLDREIPPSWPSNDLRIMILGDSFVEALQVNMNEKFGALLAASLSAKIHKPVDVLSMGMSGTGQANQYAYWRKYQKLFKPQYLVLLFIDNDIRDNDPEMSARYHRWNSLHPPRTYFTFSPDGPDGLAEIPIDEYWHAHAALLRDTEAQQSIVTRGFWSLLQKFSALGRFVLQKTAPQVGRPWNLTYQGHNIDLAYLATDMNHDPILNAGWELSAKVLAKIARECRSTNTHLVFMLGSVRPTGSADQGDYKWSKFYDWVARQAKDNGADFVSFPARIQTMGKTSSDVTVQDGHWNREGHAIAASLLEDFFLAQENLPNNK